MRNSSIGNTWLVIAFLLLSFFSALAQHKVTLQYDAAGNRINRTITLAQTRAATVEEEITSYTDVLEELSIKIYPNPTKGLLKVEIGNLKDGQVVSLLLFDMGGKQVSSRTTGTSVAEIDLHDQPDGVYILKILSEENATEWKIIKQ